MYLTLRHEISIYFPNIIIPTYYINLSNVLMNKFLLNYLEKNKKNI